MPGGPNGTGIALWVRILDEQKNEQINQVNIKTINAGKAWNQIFFEMCLYPV